MRGIRRTVIPRRAPDPEFQWLHFSRRLRLLILRCKRKGLTVMPVTRLPQETLAVIRQIAREDGETLQAVLVQAVEAYRRARMIQRLNDDFARLKTDPAAWAQEVAELEAWDATLSDDLDSKPSHD